MKKNKITLTKIEFLNEDMIPCLVKSPNSVSLIFLDIKNKNLCYDGKITLAWLKYHEIDFSKFKEHCLKVYEILEEEKIEYTIQSFCRGDRLKIEEFVKNNDIEDMIKNLIK